MQLLHPRPEVGRQPGGVGVGGGVGEGRVVLECDGVRGGVVPKELGAPPEGIDEKYTVLKTFMIRQSCDQH